MDWKTMKQLKRLGSLGNFSGAILNFGGVNICCFTRCFVDVGQHHEWEFQRRLSCERCVLWTCQIAADFLPLEVNKKSNFCADEVNDMLNKMGTSEEDLKKAIAEQAVRWLLQFLHLVFDSLLTKNRDFHLTGVTGFQDLSVQDLKLCWWYHLWQRLWSKIKCKQPAKSCAFMLVVDWS